MQTVARVALGLFMTFAGVGHLTFARDDFQAQVPDSLPLDKDAVVLASGVVEIGFGLSLLLLPRRQGQVGRLLAAFFMTYAVRNADAFGALSFAQVRRKPGGKILDSNVIIDGRIVALAQTGFLDGDLIVPAFILRELQTLSDSADPQKRTRGKRGLTVLEELRQVRPLRIEDWDDPHLPTTDDKLIRLARETGAKLLTNDTNLAKVAKLHGLDVLSIHEAAVALRPQLQAGDTLTVTISKGGQQQGQGVGYLEDGTMVVVEEGLKLRGKPAHVVVVNNVQTNVGRMIFAKLDREQP